MNIEDDPGIGLNEALGRTIDGERVARRLSRDQLGDRAGIPSRTLQRYLTGERHIPVAALERLSTALGQRSSTILRRAELRLAEERCD